jgi:hypothetical protein
VRLEADASGGELHVRATVVGDDGRAQAFRRLLVHVGGPDGFSRETALEAVGAGAYAASIPLSRPGAYLAVARDEVSGEPVATTGAVLGAGEELRPTGTDLALLSRIAELTGGKRRDTLAGLFDDRSLRRFAYEDASAALLRIAAFAFLLAVAARRLSPPAALLTWPQRLLARRSATPVAAKAPPPPTLGALLEAKDRSAQRRPPEAPAAAPTADAPPREAPPPPIARPVPAAPPSAPAAAPPPKSEQGLSSAEILLARRKKKGP